MSRGNLNLLSRSLRPDGWSMDLLLPSWFENQQQSGCARVGIWDFWPTGMNPRTDYQEPLSSRPSAGARQDRAQACSNQWEEALFSATDAPFHQNHQNTRAQSGLSHMRRHKGLDSQGHLHSLSPPHNQTHSPSVLGSKSCFRRVEKHYIGKWRRTSGGCPPHTISAWNLLPISGSSAPYLLPVVFPSRNSFPSSLSLSHTLVVAYTARMARPA